MSNRIPDRLKNLPGLLICFLRTIFISVGETCGLPRANTVRPYRVLDDFSDKNITLSLKFVLFSISAGVIQIVSFTLLEEVLCLEHWISYLVSLVLSVLWNFTLNRTYTFCSASNVPVAMLKVAGFYLIFTPLST